MTSGSFGSDANKAGCEKVRESGKPTSGKRGDRNTGIQILQSEAGFRERLKTPAPRGSGSCIFSGILFESESEPKHAAGRLLARWIAVRAAAISRTTKARWTVLLHHQCDCG